MKNKILIGLLYIAIGLLSLCHVKAQSFDLFQKHWLIKGKDTLPYRLLLPENFTPNKKYPLIIFLHGSGERGNNNEAQLTHGAALFLKAENRSQFPAIVIFPQCSRSSYWSNVNISGTGANRLFEFNSEGAPTFPMQLLTELVHQTFKKFPVQKRQVYIMGLSMGGMGTFELVNRMPKTFAAAIPICGGANPASAPNLKKTNWWVFHGGKDDVVLPKYSEDMVAAMKKSKVNVKFTLFPEANHNSWDPTFAQPGLLSWLFGQKRGWL